MHYVLFSINRIIEDGEPCPMCGEALEGNNLKVVSNWKSILDTEAID